jgi:hypothetical protein
VLAQVLELVSEHLDPSEAPGGRKHEGERRHNPATAPGIEKQRGESSLLEIGEDQAGDEIAGNDEEDIDADETAGHERRRGVKSDHQQDRDRPEAIDLRPVLRIHVA